MRFAEIVIFKLRYCRFTKPSGLRYLEILGNFSPVFRFLMFFCAVFIRISVRCCGVSTFLKLTPPIHEKWARDQPNTDCKEKNPPVFSQLVALIPSRSIRTNVGNFSKGEFLNTVSKIQEKKKEVAFLCSRPPKNVINKALSRRSRATTAEECTKKCDEWTKLLCR